MCEGDCFLFCALAFLANTQIKEEGYLSQVPQNYFQSIQTKKSRISGFVQWPKWKCNTELAALELNCV